MMCRAHTSHSFRKAESEKASKLGADPVKGYRARSARVQDVHANVLAGAAS